MSKKLLLAIPILIIITIGAYFYSKTKNTKFIPRTTGNIGQKFYQDTTLGFTFDYPKNLTFEMNNGVGFFQNQPIFVYLALSLKENSNLSFENNLIKFVSTNCGNVGGLGPEYCPENQIHLEKFTNKNKVEGYKITATKITQKYTPNETIQTSQIINEVAYKLPSRNTYFAIVFTLTNQKEFEEMFNIANSFSYLPNL